MPRYPLLDVLLVEAGHLQSNCSESASTLTMTEQEINYLKSAVSPQDQLVFSKTQVIFKLNVLAVALPDVARMVMTTPVRANQSINTPWRFVTLLPNVRVSIEDTSR